MRHLYHMLCLLLVYTGVASYALSAELEIKVGTAALSKNSIELNNSFEGDDIVIFGVINTNCTVVAKVTGPKQDIIISKKGRIYGAWLKKALIRLSDVDTFYAVVSSSSQIPAKLVRSLKLTPESIVYNTTSADAGAEYSEYIANYLQYKKKRLEFQNPDNNITFLTKNFFKINFVMPKTVSAGEYNVDIYFIKNGSVIDEVSLPFSVKNVETNENLKNLAYNHMILYAFIAIFTALILAWIMNIFLKSR